VTPIEKTNDEEFERHVLAVLVRELGPEGFARYLRLFRSGPGDYARDRHKWLDGLTMQEIVAEIERRANPTA
jgi:hypothetical protein